MDYYTLSYVLIFVSIGITLIAQIFVSTSYSKYKKVQNNKGITGAEVAREILDKHGLTNVYVTATNGTLSDHYDPKRKVVRLSKDVYEGTTIAAVSVAAHEVGHAIQDKEEYAFMRFRSALVPMVNFSSTAGYFAILIGLFFGYTSFIWLGIALEIVILLFQLITLPVEFNASSRALTLLEDCGILSEREIPSTKKVLSAAALTYVASAASGILQLLRLILLTNNRRRRD